MTKLLLLIMALGASSQEAPKAPPPRDSQDKIRSALIACMKVGADPEGRKLCAKALGDAKALAKKKPMGAQLESIGLIEGFLASLDEAPGKKVPAQKEADFDAIAQSLPVAKFKPSYAKYFPPPVPPAAQGKKTEGQKEQAKGKLSPEKQEALSKGALDTAQALLQDKREGAVPAGPKPIVTYNFNAQEYPGFHDAKNDKRWKDKDGQWKGYNVPRVRQDIPGMWAKYGDLFKKVGADLQVDPYALAAFSVFESYDDRDPRDSSTGRNFNPGMLDGNACGIAATQASDVYRARIPGLGVPLSPARDKEQACGKLRRNPEYSIRFIAQEFKERYESKAGGQDLAKTFPLVAKPGWGKPANVWGNYGDKAGYVSRAYVFYQAFQAADGK